jgi:hypothetical protein
VVQSCTSTKNPHAADETPLYPVKIVVWCAVSGRGIVGPIFFENTINSERYIGIIHEFLGHRIEEGIAEA